MSRVVNAVISRGRTFFEEQITEQLGMNESLAARWCYKDPLVRSDLRFYFEVYAFF